MLYFGFKESIYDSTNTLYYLSKYLIPINYLILWNVADSSVEFTEMERFTNFVARLIYFILLLLLKNIK